MRDSGCGWFDLSGKLADYADMKSLVPAALAVAMIAAPGQEQIPSALQAMVETERAFAQACTQKGIRDSFLEYFAGDSIAFNPAPISATERLRQRPARPFRELELRWEPRLGDVAASGELGWLTGPSTFVDHTVADSKPQPGNYLSVWRRQPDGRWRVFIDIGSQPPNPVSFAPGFNRFDFPARYSGSSSSEAAAKSLTSADQSLNAAIAKDAPAAYRDVTTAASRLHRNGFMPAIGPIAIGAWIGQFSRSMTATTGSAESAQSGDLGYSYGTYDIAGSGGKPGAYVRVWQRDASGKWWLVADVTQ
jgi:ketosteroid isomerase-like protein